MATGSGSIRAGRAFVELFAEPNKLYRALDAAKKRVLDFAKVTARIGVGAAGLGGAVLTPITKFFVDAVNEGATIERLAQQFHTTAESVSILKGAFLQAGVSGEDFEKTLEGIASKIAQTATARDEFIEGLQGLRGDQLLGKGLDEQLDLIAEQFKRIVSYEDQVRVANELGLGGILPYLKKGKAGIDELRKAAKDNGLAMTAQDAKDAQTILKEFNITVIGVKATLLSIGRALLPTGKDFASVGKDIRDSLVSVRAWIAGHKEIVVLVTAVAAALVAGGFAMVGFASALAVAVPIVTGLALAVKAVAIGVGLLISPIGLVALAVTGLTAGLTYLFLQTEKGEQFVADLKTLFAGLGDWIKASWQGISDALSAGDWTLAWKISLKSAEVAWDFFVATLTLMWIDFKATFVDTFRDAVAGIKLLFNDLYSFGTKLFFGMLRNIAEAWNKLVAGDASGKLANMFKFDLRGVPTADQIERDRKANQDDILKDRQARQKEADDFRQKQKDNAFDPLFDAIKELDDMKKRAAEEAAGSKIVGKQVPPVPDLEKALPSFTQLFAAQKGIFGGNAQQQLGYGDNIAQRQLDANNATAANTAKSATLLDKLNNKPPEVWAG